MTNNNKKIDKVDIDDELNWQDTLKIQGVMAKGYGITPKMVMLDRRLTIEAKAIYSYFCSYAGAGTTAFPSRAKIMKDLDIGKDRYYKHFNLLKETGYIEVAQARKGQGSFKSNIYTLVPNPKPLSPDKTTDNSPCPDFNDTGKTSSKTPCPDFPDTGNRDTENKDTIINRSSNINNSSIYNQSINQKIDRIDDYKTIIENNVEYHILKQFNPFNIKETNELINIMIEVLENPKGYIRINGVETPRQKIGEIFLKLKSDHIDYVLRSMNENPVKIKNLKNYLIVTLYNSYFTLDHYWKTKVNYDMSQPDFYKKD